jgi:NAD(P)-dependent dehydrogenase (short-subunit alcohol dehydrogenase family)
VKNIVIIGGNSGIGLALAKKINHENLFLFNRKGHSEVAAQTKIFDVTTDTLSENDLPEIIDGLVYCPGTINLKPFHRLQEKDYLDDFNVNVLGFIKTINACLKGLKTADNPSVVAFSTIAAKLGMPFHASIAASKGAIEGLIRTLAAEMAPKIRFNAVSISLTDTPLADKLLNTPEKKEAGAKRHPLNRIGQAEEIATTVAHILSADSAWMTGQTIHLDGGMSTIKLF